MRTRPLIDRVQNYIMFFGMPEDKLIPIHADDYTRRPSELPHIEEELGVKMYPLGYKDLRTGETS